MYESINKGGWNESGGGSQTMSLGWGVGGRRYTMRVYIGVVGMKVCV